MVRPLLRGKGKSLDKISMKNHKIQVNDMSLVLILTFFGNFCVIFSENLPIFCFLYKKFLIFWKSALSISLKGFHLWGV